MIRRIVVYYSLMQTNDEMMYRRKSILKRRLIFS